MLNNYETHDYRETLKGRLAYIPFDDKLIIEPILIPDTVVVIRAQEILLFKQIVHLAIIYILHRFTPDIVITSFPFLYMISVCSVIVITFMLKCSQDAVKRKSVSSFIFSLSDASRIFIILFAATYTTNSALYILEALLLCILMHLSFRAYIQEYYTNNEIISQLIGQQDLLQDTYQDPAFIEAVSQQSMNQPQPFQESIKELNDEDSNLTDEQRSQLMSINEQLIDQPPQQQQRVQQQQQQQEQEQQQQQQEIRHVDNIIKSFHMSNMIISLILPIFLKQFLKLSWNLVLILVLSNLMYSLFLVFHFKTYYSPQRQHIITYNKSNYLRLATAYFDADLICPLFMCFEICRISVNHSERRTRFSMI